MGRWQVGKCEAVSVWWSLSEWRSVALLGQAVIKVHKQLLAASRVASLPARWDIGRVLRLPVSEAVSEILKRPLKEAIGGGGEQQGGCQRGAC